MTYRFEDGEPWGLADKGRSDLKNLRTGELPSILGEGSAQEEYLSSTIGRWTVCASSAQEMRSWLIPRNPPVIPDQRNGGCWLRVVRVTSSSYLMARDFCLYLQRSWVPRPS